MTDAMLPRYRDADEPWRDLCARALTGAQAGHVRHTKAVTDVFLPHERPLLESVCLTIGEAHFLVSEVPHTVSVWRTTHGLQPVRRKEDAE